MGKRKTREPEDDFQQDFDRISVNSDQLQKLRRDLWLTTVKQKKIVTLIRHEEPEAANSDARNLLHYFVELARRRIQQLDELTSGYLDRQLHAYKKSLKKNPHKKPRLH